MLQPRQLEQLALRFAPEIAMLQESFRNAEPPLPTPSGLGTLAARLRTDAFFRRDLGAEILILRANANPAVSTTDLLAMVAVAAAGIAGAAASGEHDTHEVLRFLLTVTHPEVASPQDTVTDAVKRTVEPAGHRSVAVAAACLLVIVIAGVSHHWYRPAKRVLTKSSTAPAAPATPTQAAEPTASATQSIVPPMPDAHDSSALRTTTSAKRVPALRDDASRPATSATPVAAAQPLTASVEGRPVPMLGTGVTSTGRQTIPNAPLLVPQSTSHGAGTVPSSVLSQRLDARTLPPGYSVELGSSTRPYPRLLRRQPLLPVRPDGGRGDGILLAENVPSTRPGSNPVGTLAAPAGTVTPVSLGMMAANVLYSPAPAYPPAAAAARVQGQVTIQAEVGRDGTVASARVVSGPPLLRDAALDAVQQWRYRPRQVAGKAVTAAATAVVEFALP